MYKNLSSIMGSGSAMVSKFVNIGVAKKISCVLITVLLVTNVLKYLDTGFDPCRGILSSGRLLDEYEGVWQPDGCMMHKYKPSDAILCMRNKKFAFVGDSRMRELMFSLIHNINPKYETPEGKIHADVPFAEDDLNFKFYWVPELNETVTALFQLWDKKPNERPDIIFQAAATHTIKRIKSSEKAFFTYCKEFTDHLKVLDDMIENYHTKIFWILQEPVDESKLVPERKMITNTKLDQYNDALLNIMWEHSPNSKIKIIESFRWISYDLMHMSEDGLHIPKQALNAESNIILNYFCNDQLQPIDGTCCQSSPTVTPTQILLLLVGIACIVGAIVLPYLKWKSSKQSQPHNLENGDVIVQNGTLEATEKLIPENKEQQKNEEEKTKLDMTIELIIALTKYSLIMMYFYISDRTNIFMKGNKHFTNARFFLPLLYVSLLGLFGMIQTSQTSLLNRDQTDEWKGWMQLIILIYHMSGASVNIPIYMHIRILVAMYLFMTGYGHFSYFWNKGDYSLYRVVNVLFRLNFLTISLCLVMDRPYQFYYFVPLCSFWFLILYAAMAIWPRANAKMLQTTNGSEPSNGLEQDFPLKKVQLKSPYVLMSLKLFFLFFGIMLLFLYQVYYEAIFSWWPARLLFQLEDRSIREWWFRTHLDRYAMLHGAVLCFIYLIMKKLSILDDSKQGCLFSTRTSFITMTAAIGIIIFYVAWAAQCTDKVLCNRIHSYASIFPITAFIIIRNVPGYLRSGYSAFFAWFGKISLELFIGQYHIWLAADTKGMLILVSPEWPTLNLVITSFIFVCVAHEIHIITGIVTNYAVGPRNDNVKVLLRVAVFFICLCCISFIQNTFSPTMFDDDP